MRKIGLAELLDRFRQVVQATAEGAPYLGKWLLPDARKCFSVDSPAVTFSRLSQMLPMSLADGAGRRRAIAGSDRGEILLRSAENALDGRFDLLGFRELFFGVPIDWHLEPTSGKRSPRVSWRRLHSISDSKTGDKKVVWELNRHQHLPTLARAFIESGDERYAKALVDHICAWIRENPPGVGINWVSSVDIAFRCISWLWSIAMVRTWDKWTSLPVLDIWRSLYVQGRHIEDYLSTYFSPNTHLTGEGLGLYYLGTCLRDLECAARWRKLGRSILLQELDRQVRPDGVHFEQSTWYHRYTADIYMHFILLAERAGDPLPADVAERLTKLLDFLMWITKPDGTSPYLGDDDGGRLVKLEERAPDDWRAVLSGGAVMFGRGDYKHMAHDFAEETHWIFGPDARTAFERIPATPPTLTSRAFPASGFFLMRSGWGRDSNYLLLDCGPHGVMNCGHAHADALAIVVAALGETFLVDPGTYTYTGSSSFRDLFRSTAMHNTLTIDGLSSSVPRGPFKWQQVANSTARCWHDHQWFTFFEGDHDGYRRLPDPAMHSRSVLFVNREYWVVLDRVDANGDHQHATHFHMAAGTDAVVNHGAGRLEARRDSIILDITFPGLHGRWELGDGLVSPCYGSQMPAPCGAYLSRATGPAQTLFVLFPRNHRQPPPDIRNLHLGQASGLVLATPQYDDLVLLSGTAAPEERLRATNFAWVWVRRSQGSRMLERAALMHGTQFVSDDVEVETDRPACFVAIAVQDRALSVDVFPAVGIRIRAPAYVDHVMVNGRKRAADTRETLLVADAPELNVPRDRTDFCSHVRY